MKKRKPAAMEKPIKVQLRLWLQGRLRSQVFKLDREFSVTVGEKEFKMKLKRDFYEELKWKRKKKKIIAIRTPATTHLVLQFGGAANFWK